jgi:flagellar L-ring protein precursor FlgH
MPLLRSISVLALVVGAGLQAGCATMAAMDDLPPRNESHAAAVPLANDQPPPPATGAIFRPGTGSPLVGKVRRFGVGDVITVILNESTQANRAATANVSRAATNDVVPSGLTSRLTNLSKSLTGINLNSGNVESKGEGSADQSASLTGSVTVSVVEVQPNGNLVVRGEKRLSLTQGTEMIQVSGIVRPEDVAPNNTVQSRRLANANFAYQGGGELGSVARSGWGTRALLHYWPF